LESFPLDITKGLAIIGQKEFGVKIFFGVKSLFYAVLSSPCNNAIVLRLKVKFS